RHLVDAASSATERFLERLRVDGPGLYRAGAGSAETETASQALAPADAVHGSVVGTEAGR
ncbi:hypothetical protein ACF1B6_40135, partial [Streptomyces flaveolus]